MDPLQYPSRAPVFQYFPFSKRKSLAKRCVQVRKWHRTLPICFEKVRVREEEVIIDDKVIWERNYYNEETKELERQEAEKLLNFYVFRKGTVISQLLISNYFSCFIGIPGVFIGKFDISVYEYDDSVTQFFNYYQHKVLNNVKIHSGWRRPTILEEIKNLKIGMLYCAPANVTAELMMELNQKGLQIYEYTQDGSTYLERFKIFFEKDLAIGSYYYTTFANDDDGHINIDFLEISKVMREQFGMENKFMYFMPMLAKEMKDYEILVYGGYDELDWWTKQMYLKVLIEKKGKTTRNLSIGMYLLYIACQMRWKTTDLIYSWHFPTNRFIRRYWWKIFHFLKFINKWYLFFLSFMVQFIVSLGIFFGICWIFDLLSLPFIIFISLLSLGLSSFSFYKTFKYLRYATRGLLQDIH